MSATILAFDPRTSRAEDVLNCHGISFELWLSRVEMITGSLSASTCMRAWHAWEQGVSTADYALHVQDGGARD